MKNPTIKPTPAKAKMSLDQAKKNLAESLTQQIRAAEEELSDAVSKLESSPFSGLSHMLALADDWFYAAATQEVCTQALRLTSMPWEDILKEIQTHIWPTQASSTSHSSNLMNKARLNAWLTVYRDANLLTASMES